MLIFAAFIVIFVFPFLFDWLEKRSFARLTNLVCFIGLIAAIYCIVSGVHLLGDWENPFADADPEILAKSGVRGKGRGTIFLLIIMLWPFVLIVWGGLVGFISWVHLMFSKQLSSS